MNPRLTVSDVDEAQWIRLGLHPFAQDVGSLVPPGFDEYARIFHPADRDGAHVMWRDIARSNGRVMHPEVQFGPVSGSWTKSPDPSLWTAPPKTGTLPIEFVGALNDVLSARTLDADECRFAIWTGWTFDEELRTARRFKLPHREYYVTVGPLQVALDGVYGPGFSYQSPSMWWPEDHSWFVSTDVDLAYSYMGASRDVIAAVVAHPKIEAMRVQRGHRITWDADRINPSVGSPH
ncbi:MAG: hypothetical protein ACM3SX_23270 [Deltaproteobacteria bacterium]